MIVGRRALLRLAGLAAAAPLLRGIPAVALDAVRFTPPAAPMRYTRRFERGLADGASLVVTRRFAVRFVPDADGFRLDGSQTDVEVAAPEALEPLMRLERERVESGLFPLQLDRAGAIRSIDSAASNAQLDEAAREVAARIERWPHTPAERAELRAFVDAVHRSAGGLLTELPRDLFAPVDVPREERRAIALPDGETGEVRMTFTATRDPASGLMREARRELVTEVADTRKLTLESWSLVPT